MNAGSEAKCQQEMEVCITGGGSAPRASTPLEHWRRRSVRHRRL